MHPDVLDGHAVCLVPRFSAKFPCELKDLLDHDFRAETSFFVFFPSKRYQKRMKGVSVE